MTKRFEHLFSPARLPRRDIHGLVVHPDIRPFYKQMNWWVTLEEMGFEEQVDVVMDKACEKRFCRAAREDCSWWLPMPPDGGNWRLVSIHAYLGYKSPIAFYVRHRKFSGPNDPVPVNHAKT